MKGVYRVSRVTEVAMVVQGSSEGTLSMFLSQLTAPLLLTSVYSSAHVSLFPMLQEGVKLSNICLPKGSLSIHVIATQEGALY